MCSSVFDGTLKPLNLKNIVQLLIVNNSMVDSKSKGLNYKMLYNSFFSEIFHKNFRCLSN